MSLHRARQPDFASRQQLAPFSGSAARGENGATVTQSMQQVLNRALDEILAENIFREDCGRLGGVFRVTDGLQAKHGAERRCSSRLRLPRHQPGRCQIARVNYRSQGTLPMPVTLPVPSFGGIRAPEHHGESLEALFAHVPGLKVVSPSNPHEAYHLLKYAATRRDPLIFMKPEVALLAKGAVDLNTAETAGNAPPGPR